MIPGVSGGGAGAFVLLAILIYLLIAGGDDNGVDPAPGDRSSEAGHGVRPGASIDARVVRVVDGDTVEVSIDGAVDDVRYIGVDTPETVKPGEPVECYGPEASDFNHELVEGRTVRLEFDLELRDAYNRLLAYVYVGERFVNQELLRGGFARTLEIEPNTSRADQLARVQREAGAAGVGLWGAC